MGNDLIVVQQLPIINERLHELKAHWEKMAKDAEAMVCTPETIQSVKSARAEMRKEFEEIEALRKEVKKAVTGPYEKFLEVYTECVLAAFQMSDAIFAKKIANVENAIKQECEDGLRDYFDELCAVHHLDWLSYDRAGIRVDMASAKAKTPARLRMQLMEFVVGVAEAVERISGLEDASEIMVEFKKSLNAAHAICIVQERHRRIEEQRKAQEARSAVVQQEKEAIRRVEALAPPVQKEPPQTVQCTFTVHTTMDKLKKLKTFLEMEGIQHE